MGVKEVILSFRKKIWHLLINLNLYKEDDDETATTPPDDNGVQMQIWSTRLFLGSFLAAFIVLVMLTSIPKQLITTTIKNPSVKIYDELQSKYGDLVQCPCSQFNIPMGNYINVTVKYHQVCSSDFVRERWIEASYGANVSYVWPMDSRTIISAHAQFLRSFCNLSQTLVDEALFSLTSTSYLNSKSISSTVLTSQVKTRLDELQSSIAASLNLQLNIIRRLNSANQLMSGLGTNVLPLISPYGLIPYYSIDLSTYSYNLVTSPSTVCSCLGGDSCLFPSGIYSVEQSVSYMIETTGSLNSVRVEDNSSTLITGLKAACVPFESFLSSTLECYYNMSCIQVFIASDINIKPLDPTKKTRYNIVNTTMESLIGSLFIEEFNNTVDHGTFFASCAPRSCSYTIMQRNNLVTIVTTIVTLIGGLNAILKFLCLLFAKLFVIVKNKNKGRSNSSVQSTIEVSTSLSRKKRWLNLINEKLVNLNTFKSQSRSAVAIKRQRWSTRIYILVLIITVTILTLYSVFKKSLIKITVNEPSEDQYQMLYSIYNDSIECPCQEIVINYTDILQVKVRYHPICSSDFISPTFYSQMNLINEIIWNEDFLAGGSAYFRLLESMCLLVQTTVNNSYKQFQSIEYVHQTLLSSTRFLNQTNSYIDTFINNTREEFFRSLFLTREVTSSNQLETLSSSNFYIYLNSYYTIITTSSWDYTPGSGSFCGSSKDPSKPAGFYNETSGTIEWAIPGLNRGCFLIESLLQSSFECWYNDDCIRVFANYTSARSKSPLITPSVLNETETRFPINTTFDDILNQLIAEEWIRSINYSAFYSKCSPQSCTYTLLKRDDIINVVRTVVGICGGLNKILRVFIPLIIMILFFTHSIYKNWKQTNHVIARANYLEKIRHSIISFNLFPNVENTNEKCQRIGTRIYIIILTLVMIGFVPYKIMNKSTTQIIISKPSFDKYMELYNLTDSHPSDNFECACSTVSVSYTDFVLQTNTSVHQVCNSWPVQDEWMVIVAVPYEEEFIFLPDSYWNDSKQYGQSFFRGIKSLCTISETILTSYWKESFTQQLISFNLLTEDQFHIEVNQNINTGQEKLISYLTSLMELIRGIMKGNQYMSAFRTNWLYYIRPDYTDPLYPLAIRPLSHGTNCSCSTSLQCVEQYFYINRTTGEIFDVPGVYVGCFPIDGVMVSTLECFYSQSCVDSLSSIFRIDSYGFSPFSALNLSSSSNYQLNTTVSEMFRNLFIEEFSVNMSYRNYFDKCAPSSCSYMETISDNWIDILIALLGIYGGLVIVLRFVIPYLIEILYKISQRRRKQTTLQVKPMLSISIEHVSNNQ